MERRIRLRRAGDFERVRRKGRSWSHPLLVLIACPNGLDHSRIGVIASRRLGSAVARNRAKRCLRESVRNLYTMIESGWDLLLIARPAILKNSTPVVQETILHLGERAGLILPGPKG